MDYFATWVTKILQNLIYSPFIIYEIYQYYTCIKYVEVLYYKKERSSFFKMRLDSAFVKEILITMVKYDDYLINSHTLMSLLNVKGKEMERKFMGHILILGDEGLIESIYSKFPFGFVNSVDGNYSIVDTGYRLTSKGFKMVEVLMSS